MTGRGRPARRYWVKYAMKLAPIVLAVGMALPAAPFDQAKPGYVFQFPRDHFEHPGFAAEWWYYTGNLATSEGRPFGFELTFFRVAVDRKSGPETAWDPDQVYLTHFVVTDIKGERLHHRERVNRSGPGIAGASESEGVIWNGNWSVEFLPGDPRRPSQRIRAGDGGVSLELDLVPAKPVVIHGTEGVSQKARGEGQASHYSSFTRLVADGKITVEGAEHRVEGLAWMDHEFFTNNLSDDQVGWDWMSIQLDDGSDLMIYALRSVTGEHSEFSGGTFVGDDGTQVRLVAEDLRLTPGRKWRSTETGADYPVEWTVEIPRIELTLNVSPLLDAQEVLSAFSLTPVYWEGAVEYCGKRAGRTVTGKGYLEMTGYDKPVVLVP